MVIFLNRIVMQIVLYKLQHDVYALLTLYLDPYS